MIILIIIIIIIIIIVVVVVVVIVIITGSSCVIRKCFCFSLRCLKYFYCYSLSVCVCNVGTACSGWTGVFAEVKMGNGGYRSLKKLSQLLSEHVFALDQSFTAVGQDCSGRSHNRSAVLWCGILMLRISCSFSVWRRFYMYPWLYAHCICLSVLALQSMHPGGRGQLLITGTVFLVSPRLALTW